ncbi:hypothetical protein BDY17DRAFT_110693 [Neohortaea acidophila]|uniref:Uncharacterized protein n=1 Tax=Neohortaea acidophila TaxID=245834 RepID=A0A6A6Q0E1_9PEZI|nr:uncharacterized protein BDY17DRAFT_110693 [Neohortaea acidophila]KAF2485725.1 hypothetical protein BDY17DRAFT_110693 [Neohortaea acidophila]
MESPISREIERIRRFICRKEKAWRKHASIAQTHESPDEMPPLVPFTTYDDLIAALQARYEEMCARVEAQLADGAPTRLVRRLPQRSIPDMIGRAVQEPRGCETIYGQIAHATELIAREVGCVELMVIKMEQGIDLAFKTLHEELTSLTSLHAWAWNHARRGYEWAEKLAAAEEDIFTRSQGGNHVELGDIAALEWLRDAAVDAGAHNKRLDFDVETALLNMRDLAPCMEWMMREVGKRVGNHTATLEMLYGFNLRRQSLITEYFKASEEDSDTSGDSSDDGTDVDEESRESSDSDGGMSNEEE